jgi:hypothetical protein
MKSKTTKQSIEKARAYHLFSRIGKNTESSFLILKIKKPADFTLRKDLEI